MALDLNDDRVISLLAALGLLYFSITKPFWNILHSKVQYTHFHKYVQKMRAECVYLSINVDAFFMEFRGIFTDFPEEQTPVLVSVRQYIQTAPDRKLILSSLKDLLEAFVVVMDRQLPEFLTGKYSAAPDLYTERRLAAVPLHNLLGENAFGDLDYELSRRRHSSMHHLSTIHMLKINKTSQWMGEKSDEIQDDLWARCRAKGPSLKKAHMKQEQVVRALIRKQGEERTAAKKEKERKTESD